MRRTLAMVVGASLAVTLAGATAYARTVAGSSPAPVAVAAPASDGTAAPYGARTTAGTVAAEPAAKAPAAARAQDSRTESVPSGTSTALGRETVGALENVSSLLGYANEGTSQTFAYPGAQYVKVHFDRMTLLPGDYVTVADAAGTETHRIESDPLTAVGGLLGSRADASGRWAMSVEGDTAVVTLHRARPALLGGVERLAGLGVSVDRIARGFTPAERAAREAKRAREAASATGREESVCGRDESKDAVCYKSADPVAYNRSKAVARLLINGTELCTGWRLGPTNRMMTNNHCMVTSDDAYDTEVWFNYQCAQCGGHAVFKSTKVWGDRVLSTNRDLDYTLFTLENFAPVQKFGYLSIDTARPAKGTEVYIPQHPGGDPTRIAMTSDRDSKGNCAVDDPLYDGYAKDSDVSYQCDTAGGSSGSPVISRKSDKVIAIHHFGGCPNSGVRIDLIYSKIKKLL